MLRGTVAVTNDPILFDPAERPATAYMGVEAMAKAQVAASATPPELAPHRRARRLTLPTPILAPAAAPGAPPDPTACTCDPKRWRGVSAGRTRHEPTCPRRTTPERPG